MNRGDAESVDERRPRVLGPRVRSRTTIRLPVDYVKPVAVRSLCGQSLDWVEAVTQ